MTAAEGFASGSAAPILVAALLALPMSIVELSGYYAANAVLTLVSGGDPSNSSASSP